MLLPHEATSVGLYSSEVIHKDVGIHKSGGVVGKISQDHRGLQTALAGQWQDWPGSNQRTAQHCQFLFGSSWLFWAFFAVDRPESGGIPTPAALLHLECHSVISGSVDFGSCRHLALDVSHTKDEYMSGRVKKSKRKRVRQIEWLATRKILLQKDFHVSRFSKAPGAIVRAER